MNQKWLLQRFILFGLFIFGIIMWFFIRPEELSIKSWHLFIIFLYTIFGIIFNLLPAGQLALLSILICTLTNTLKLEECLSSFSDEIVWLMVFSFLISHGFTKTTLGIRIAYLLIKLLGKSTLGLAYSLIFTDLIFSPVIPSVTARGCGILFPIAKSLCHEYQSKGTTNFFMIICFQSNVITSAMFVTAMAANSIAVKLSVPFGVNITWLQWATAASVPGIVCLIVMPLIVYYYVHPPAVKCLDVVPTLAKAKLKAIGPISIDEKLVILIFFILILLWIYGKKLFNINIATTALIGLCSLLSLRIIKFEEVISDKNIWHLFIWFSTILMISSFLSKFGITTWVSNNLKLSFGHFSPVTLFCLLSLIYFYIHYIFASTTAHIIVLFPSFLSLFIELGVNEQIATLILIFLSIFSSGLTHFGLSSAPIFYSNSYLKVKTWWYSGFIISIMYIIIWITIGSIWWKIIGLW
jgi:DASS family divalent anion:Na+ symporter